jgi:hypothetical protein
LTITNVLQQLQPTQEQQSIAPFLLKCAMQSQAAFELRMVHIDEHVLVRLDKRFH